MNKQKVEAFLKDIVALCKVHRMSISHEDSQGAFIVEEYNNKNILWLMAAKDEHDKTNIHNSDNNNINNS